MAGSSPSSVPASKPTSVWKNKNSLFKRMLVRYDLYLMLLLPLAWYITFQYVPIYGLQIAFKDYVAAKGIMGSEWVGLKQFERFFSSYYFWRLIWNTVSISLYTLLLGFPIPIALAILVNEIKHVDFKKWLQNVTYIPHFISVVVIVGMLQVFLAPSYGLINQLLVAIGKEPISFLLVPEWFKTLFVTSGIWQNMGWNSIIFIAALAGIDPSLYEAAMLDGASRFRRILSISIPGIMPTIVIMFILSIGHIMDVGFEKVLLMQHDLNLSSSEVIATFIFKEGIQKGEFSYTAAIGLFNSLINFTLLVVVNAVARKKSETSLW
ncbi:putative aldouronate transport system permease protein [Paenibacillus sp. 1_12]|uniref:ABC transporter permease n=1 Tax=Paenibacillus sp. 1_12 TaxID=1566278 RepID=UPI0008E1FB49|nr:ABC transporter permease subunit [Paenibacillus sp. 1_12]SFK98884.1 putative aldouronate transport system permease protein [Paenibacillus sp. 1_12]